jgi:hypothetical protein
VVFKAPINNIGEDPYKFITGINFEGENLSYIGHGTFYDNKIKDLTIPQNVEIIYGRAFQSYYNRNPSLSSNILHLNFAGEQNSKLKVIHSNAFRGVQIQTLNLPPNLLMIGYDAFATPFNPI